MSQIPYEMLKRANRIDAKANFGSHADKAKQESLISEAEKMGVKADSATSATMRLFCLLGPYGFRSWPWPQNIAEFGYSDAEVALTKGKPDTSVLIHPMPAPPSVGASRKLAKRK